MRNHYAKTNNLSQLHDEILAECLDVRPVNGFAQMAVEGDGVNIWLTLPNDLSEEAQQQIDGIVAAHVAREVFQPNWSGFRVAMLQNNGYQRITLLANTDNNGRLAVTRTETTMAMNKPNLEVIEVLWEQVIASLPLLSKPTAIEVGQWNTIATTNNMPFLFKSDGKMQL